MVQGEGKPAAAMGGGYTVTINSDVNYVNLARVTALNVTTNQTQPLDFLRLWNNALGTDMTSSQLTTMILLHEFRHTVPGGDAKQEYDPIAFNTPIVKDCIK